MATSGVDSHAPITRGNKQPLAPARQACPLWSQAHNSTLRFTKRIEDSLRRMQRGSKTPSTNGRNRTINRAVKGVGHAEGAMVLTIWSWLGLGDPYPCPSCAAAPSGLRQVWGTALQATRGCHVHTHRGTPATVLHHRPVSQTNSLA